MAKRKLLVEGWRFLPHSYAMVNQWQLLALGRRPDLDLRVRELPLPFAAWQRKAGTMDMQREAALNALAAPDADFVPEATLRLSWPFDLHPAPHGRTFVFCTSEFQAFTADDWATPVDSAMLRSRADLSIVTPSPWSAEGFKRFGIPEDRIHIVPHGVAADVFAPEHEDKLTMRARLGIGDGVVFMNASAMTPNKGADLLLRAFATLCLQRDDVYLLLKGTDDLYNSSARLGMAMRNLPPALQQRIATRTIYGGTTLSTKEMAGLYRAADIYVSPYRAEGFNLPVLEAMASGLPVICTAGGPTEDFVTDACGAKIVSRRVATLMPDGGQGIELQPDPDHLAALMARAADDVAWRRQSGAAARLQAEKFTWDAAVDRLLAILF